MVKGQPFTRMSFSVVEDRMAGIDVVADPERVHGSPRPSSALVDFGLNLPHTELIILDQRAGDALLECKAQIASTYEMEEDLPCRKVDCGGDRRHAPGGATHDHHLRGRLRGIPAGHVHRKHQLQFDGDQATISPAATSTSTGPYTVNFAGKNTKCVGLYGTSLTVSIASTGQTVKLKRSTDAFFNFVVPAGTGAPGSLCNTLLGGGTAPAIPAFPINWSGSGGTIVPTTTTFPPVGTWCPA